MIDPFLLTEFNDEEITQNEIQVNPSNLSNQHQDNRSPDEITLPSSIFQSTNPDPEIPNNAPCDQLLGGNIEKVEGALEVNGVSGYLEILNSHLIAQLEEEEICVHNKQDIILMIDSGMNELTGKLSEQDLDEGVSPENCDQNKVAKISTDLDDIYGRIIQDYQRMWSEGCCEFQGPLSNISGEKSFDTFERFRGRWIDWLEDNDINPIEFDDVFREIENKIFTIANSPRDNFVKNFTDCTKTIIDTEAKFEEYLDKCQMLFESEMLARLGEVNMANLLQNQEGLTIHIPSDGGDATLLILGILGLGFGVAGIFTGGSAWGIGLGIASSVLGGVAAGGDVIQTIQGDSLELSSDQIQRLSLLALDMLPKEKQDEIEHIVDQYIQSQARIRLSLDGPIEQNLEEFKKIIDEAVRLAAQMSSEAVDANNTEFFEQLITSERVQNDPELIKDIIFIALNSESVRSNEELLREIIEQIRQMLREIEGQDTSLLDDVLASLNINVATASALQIPYQQLPIALESVDCIGEHCESFPRLRYRVRAIQPGRSLNNYEYSPQMLRRSTRLLEGVPVQAYGFGQYKPMFSHLPTDLDPMQPSGFALNRVGVLQEPAYESHPDFGEGLFATLVVDKAAEGWAKAILDEATTPGGNGTGVSIFADIDGDYGYDDLTDEMYVRVNAIRNFRSVDLASQPAAGGAIVAAMEDVGWEQREYLEQLKEEIQKLSIEEIIEARRGNHRR